MTDQKPSPTSTQQPFADTGATSGKPFVRVIPAAQSSTGMVYARGNDTVAVDPRTGDAYDPNTGIAFSKV